MTNVLIATPDEEESEQERLKGLILLVLRHLRSHSPTRGKNVLKGPVARLADEMGMSADDLVSVLREGRSTLSVHGFSIRPYEIEGADTTINFWFDDGNMRALPNVEEEREALRWVGLRTSPDHPLRRLGAPYSGKRQA